MAFFVVDVVVIDDIRHVPASRDAKLVIVDDHLHHSSHDIRWTVIQRWKHEEDARRARYGRDKGILRVGCGQNASDIQTVSRLTSLR